MLNNEEIRILRPTAIRQILLAAFAACMLGASLAVLLIARILLGVVEGIELLLRPSAVCAAVTAISFAVIAMAFLRRSEYLRLEQSQLVIGSLFYIRAIPWGDIEAFKAVHIGHRTRLVGYRLIARQDDRAGSTFAARHWGVDGLLPSNYSLKVDELRAILDERLSSGRSEGN